jgi:phospholipase/carboxylesterase
VLLRAMVPLSQPPAVSFSSKAILILSGAMDQMIPAANTERLAALFRKAGAEVQHRTLPAGHGLSQADVAIAKEWLARLQPTP